jgi:hypothetical protein
VDRLTGISRYKLHVQVRKLPTKLIGKLQRLGEWGLNREMPKER